MCGIAGLLYADRERPIETSSLGRMADSLAHRGPDAGRVWAAAGVGLAHRRLSVIDLEGGDQPMSNSHGTLRVVFNGEIYNYRSLRSQLEQRGHRFRNHSDTEVLLHLYQERGENLVTELRGMFAFAIWDERRRQLLLARDRVGIKPLYVYRDAKQFAFGSELKALLAGVDIPREVDLAALDDYFTYGMVQGTRSILKNVMRIAPGTTLVVQQEGLTERSHRYWALRFDARWDWTEAEAQEEVRSKVAETVRTHLVADVPVGAFLSGGVDSSVVVRLASGASNRRLKTFSIGFAEQAFDELPYARIVASLCGTEHHEQIVSPDSVALVDQLVHFFDEPFADASAIPTFLVSKLAAQRVKVVLSGDGGDEAFGGYPRYAGDLREGRVRQWVPAPIRSQILAPLASAWPEAQWLPRALRAKTFLTNVALPPAKAYANTLAVCRRPQRHQLLMPEVHRVLNGYDSGHLITTAYDSVKPDDPIAAMMAADISVRLPDDYLVKVDRASMAHGLEVRPPFLDHELLELTSTIPSHFKVRHGQTKRLLKDAFRDVLPASATDRPKQGFAVPLDQWFRGPLRQRVEDELLHFRGRFNTLVEIGYVGRLLREHVSRVANHGSTLWAVFVLAKWVDTYLSPRPAISFGGADALRVRVS